MTAVRSFSTNSGTGASSIAITAPSGTAVTDVVIVMLQTNNTDACSDNNGATPFTEDLGVNVVPTNGFRWSIFSRRIQSGDPGTYNFTISPATSRVTGHAVAIQDPHASSIYDVAPASGNINSGSAQTSVDAPSITTNFANALLFACGGTDGDNQTITGTPSGYDVVVNQGQSRLAICTKVLASAGASGAASSFTHASNTSGAIHFAIRDAGGGISIPTLRTVQSNLRW